jgi:hypothetical protein
LRAIPRNTGLIQVLLWPPALHKTGRLQAVNPPGASPGRNGERNRSAKDCKKLFNELFRSPKFTLSSAGFPIPSPGTARSQRHSCTTAPYFRSRMLLESHRTTPPRSPRLQSSSPKSGTSLNEAPVRAASSRINASVSASKVTVVLTQASFHQCECCRYRKVFPVAAVKWSS